MRDSRPDAGLGTARLPYGRQSLDEDDIDEVLSALRSDFLTTGPRIGEFETAMCASTGAAHASALNSGTAALHAAYAAVGVGQGDEVVTTALTFAATGNAALYLGARPVFADIEDEFGTLSPVAAREALTNRTRAIVAVDYAGQPCDYAALRALASEAGVALVADAAHSLGATDKGERVGTLADATILSFHPVKHVTTGEGGAVLTNDAALDLYVREFRTHGMTRDPEKLESPDGPWSMEMHTLGFNYRLTDIQAALGIAQLRKLPRFIERRRSIAHAYSEALVGLQSLILPAERPGSKHAWHLYVVRVAGDPRTRRPFFEALQASGLGVQVHYVPVYRHPYYRNLGYRPGLCPAAEDFYSRCVSLPIFPRMTDDDVARVIETVRRLAMEMLS